MTDMHNKRRYAGPTVAERRKTDERSKLHLSPHQKPRKWVLTLEWTEVVTLRRTRTFTSKAARDESRRRIERHFREESEKLKREPVKRWRWYRPNNSVFADYGDEQVNVIKDGPHYIESYGDN